MTTKELSEEIFKRYGAVTRARGYFLYTKKGVRLTDLFLEDGRAILGWHTGSSFTQLKNILSRGLTGSFRTEETFRLEKAISELLKKDFCVFCFADKKSALAAALKLSKDNSAVWKPFNTAIDYSKFDSVVLCPPFCWTNTIFLLAADKRLCAEALGTSVAAASTTMTALSPAVKVDKTEKATLATFPIELSGEIKLPFALEGGITRSIYDYIAEAKLREEKDWFIYDTFLNPYFTRTGCYLTPKVPQEKYDDFVLYCLDKHFVINPHFEGQSFVPYKVDKGNFTAIKNSPFKY